MPDGQAPATSGSPSRPGRAPAGGGAAGAAGAAGARRRAAEVFDELERAEAARAPRPAPDAADLRGGPPPAEPTTGDLVSRVKEARHGERGFAIVRDPNGVTRLYLSGRVDPAVLRTQQLPVPRQELRAFASSTQQWIMLIQSFETSVVQVQALIATKLAEGTITRAEAQEALRIQYGSLRPDAGPPVLRFLARNPEYQDLFGISSRP